MIWVDVQEGDDIEIMERYNMDDMDYDEDQEFDGVLDDAWNDDDYEDEEDEEWRDKDEEDEEDEEWRDKDDRPDYDWDDDYE